MGKIEARVAPDFAPFSPIRLAYGLNRGLKMSLSETFCCVIILRILINIL